MINFNKFYDKVGGRKQFNYYLVFGTFVVSHFMGNDISKLADALFPFFVAAITGHAATDIATIIKSQKNGNKDVTNEVSSKPSAPVDPNK